jgi:hypothetical protein
MGRGIAFGFLLCLVVPIRASGEDAPPPRPFGDAGGAGQVREATVTLSTGRSLDQAAVKARADQLVLVMPDGGKTRLEIEFAKVRTLRQAVAAEGMEKEWRWKEGGSNEKIDTGRSYPWRKYGIELVLDDGTEIKGALTAGFPLTIRYLTEAMASADVPGGPKAGDPVPAPVEEQFLIQPRNKGEMWQALKELMYVKEMNFRAPGAPENSKRDARK